VFQRAPGAVEGDQRDVRRPSPRGHGAGVGHARLPHGGQVLPDRQDTTTPGEGGVT